jgi:hypothetical protein
MQERTGAHLEQIEAFAAVSEHQGIAAAARALGRDPSVISRRLDALEAAFTQRWTAPWLPDFVRAHPGPPARPEDPAAILATMEPCRVTAPLPYSTLGCWILR